MMTFADLVGSVYPSHWRVREDQKKVTARVRAHFGDALASDVTLESLERYDEAGDCGYSDLALIMEALKAAHLWVPPISDEFLIYGDSPYRRPEPIGVRGIDRLLRVASSSPEWKLIHQCIRVALGTATDIFDEVRFLRLRDMDFDAGTIRIRKYVFTPERIVPMAGESAQALTRLMEIARDAGSTQPEHYLIPFRSGRKNPKYTHTRPITFTILFREYQEMEKSGGNLPRLFSLRSTALRNYPELRETAGVHRYERLPEDTFFSERANKVYQEIVKAPVPVPDIPETQPEPGIEAHADDELDVLRKVAILVRDTRIDVETALAIVRGAAKKPTSIREDAFSLSERASSAIRDIPNKIAVPGTRKGEI
jgi:integrase